MNSFSIDMVFLFQVKKAATNWSWEDEELMYEMNQRDTKRQKRRQVRHSARVFYFIPFMYVINECDVLLIFFRSMK